MKNDILFLDFFVDLFFVNFVRSEVCKFDEISILIIAFYNHKEVKTTVQFFAKIVEGLLRYSFLWKYFTIY